MRGFTITWWTQILEWFLIIRIWISFSRRLLCSKERHFSQLFAAIGHFSPLQISLDIQKVLFNLVSISFMVSDAILELFDIITLFLCRIIFENWHFTKRFLFLSYLVWNFRYLVNKSVTGSQKRSRNHWKVMEGHCGQNEVKEGYSIGDELSM